MRSTEDGKTTIFRNGFLSAASIQMAGCEFQIPEHFWGE